VTPNQTPAINNRHTWTTGTGTDPYGGFPIVSPGGGLHSLKLGNNGIGALAERARYTLTVPSGVNNYSLVYRYAVVFEDPQHIVSDQPRFEVKAFNTATNVVIPCTHRTYVASSALPGFSLSPIGSSVWYHPWTMGTINLTGYAGQTITIEFSTGDCALTGHFGYGYVDMNCSLFQISNNTCDNSATDTLVAPPGYQYYTWMDATYTNIVDTGRVVVIATPSTSTTYHVILTPFNGLGCVDTLTTTLNISNLQLSVSNDTTLCAGTSTTLSATGSATTPPVTYNWAPVPGLGCTNCPSNTVTPTASTIYFVTATDGNGCTKTDSIAVRVDQVQLLASHTNVGCFGANTGTGNATLSNGIPPFAYSWNTVPVQLVNAIGSLPAGNYIVTASDSFCTLRDTIQITEPTQLNANVATTTVSCFGGGNATATAAVSGGVAPYTYMWNTAPPATSATLSNIAAGSYMLTVTDSNGCQDTTAFTILQPSQLNVSIAPTSNVSCFGGSDGSATANGAGGTPPYTYSWNSLPAQNTATATNLPAGSYIVLITDSKGCADTAQVTITQPTALLASIGTNVPVSCFFATDGSATVNATGGTTPYFYSWNTIPAQTSNTASALPVGNFTCTITDAKGCIATATASITYPNPLVAAIAPPVPINCFGDSTGVATVSATGGRPPYTYRWNTVPIQTSQTATGLKAGSYAAFVTDSAGCIDTITVIISQQPEIFISTTPQPTCPNTSQGSASVAATGGVAPYAFSWNTSPPQSGTNATNLSAGTYFVTVTDSKGCKKSTSIAIDTFTAPHVMARADTILCEGKPVQLFASGAITYSWSPAASLSCSSCPAPMANPGQDITYTVVGTDINNCKDTDQVVITVLHRVPVTAGGNFEVCEGESVTLSAAGGVAYNWQPSASLSNSKSGNPVATPSTTTNYSVVIKENECFSDTMYQTVIVEPYPTVELGPDLKALPAATLYLKADTTHAVSLLWSPITGLSCDQCDDPIAIVENTITYTVLAKNRLGCETKDDITITVGCNTSSFYMANTFTPNGDGLNDVYFPRGLGVDKIEYFMIYNRWGELMFEAKNFPCNDDHYGWNGMYRSEPMKTDVYVYILEATCGDGEKMRIKGDVTLYR